MKFAQQLDSQSRDVQYELAPARMRLKELRDSNLQMSGSMQTADGGMKRTKTVVLRGEVEEFQFLHAAERKAQRKRERRRQVFGLRALLRENPKRCVSLAPF